MSKFWKGILVFREPKVSCNICKWKHAGSLSYIVNPGLRQEESIPRYISRTHFIIILVLTETANIHMCQIQGETQYCKRTSLFWAKFLSSDNIVTNLKISKRNPSH